MGGEAKRGTDVYALKAVMCRQGGVIAVESSGPIALSLKSTSS